MTLRLRIVSDQWRSLGERRSSIELGAEGGTIGRSASNDWVLPDPMRYVSAHHGRILYRDGHYFFEDVSTNGSYVNDGKKPIGKSNLHQLRNGDVLRLGEYHISVAVEAAMLQSFEDMQVDLPDVPSRINTLQPVSRASQTDIGAQFDVNDLLLNDAASVATSPANSGSAPRPVPGAQSLLSDEPTDSGIARRIERLAKGINRSTVGRNGASAPALYDVQSGLEAFCRGAGIDAEKLPPDAQTRMMHLIGQLFREVLVGLKDLERFRTELRNRFRIEVAVDADDPRPSLSKLTADELIITLFHKHELRSTDAVQWLREEMAALKDHEHAVSQAMRSAFVEFLDRLDPAELEARFERAARRGKSKVDRAQYWALYTEFYRNLIEMPADHLPHVFIEAFATAYREQAKKPA